MRRQFLSERGHRIRFVFLPKHTSWLNQIEIVFGMIMRKVVRRGNFASVTDLKENCCGSSAISTRFSPSRSAGHLQAGRCKRVAWTNQAGKPSRCLPNTDSGY